MHWNSKSQVKIARFLAGRRPVRSKHRNKDNYNLPLRILPLYRKITLGTVRRIRYVPKQFFRRLFAFLEAAWQWSMNSFGIQRLHLFLSVAFELSIQTRCSNRGINISLRWACDPLCMICLSSPRVLVSFLKALCFIAQTLPGNVIFSLISLILRCSMQNYKTYIQTNVYGGHYVLWIPSCPCDGQKTCLLVDCREGASSGPKKGQGAYATAKSSSSDSEMAWTIASCR